MGARTIAHKRAGKLVLAWLPRRGHLPLMASKAQTTKAWLGDVDAAADQGGEESFPATLVRAMLTSRAGYKLRLPPI